MPSNIPKARKILEDLSAEINDNYIRASIQSALALMTRDFNGRSSVQSDRMTDEKRQEILAALKEHPGLNRQSIAEMLGVNQGRVSETAAKAAAKATSKATATRWS